MTAIAVMVLIETDDPTLQPGNLDTTTAQAVARLRQKIINALPDLRRVVCVMDEEQARVMMLAHNMAMLKSGATVLWPPVTYVPPTMD
jgi:hypothetical protein